jgi:hypothetical protein
MDQYLYIPLHTIFRGWTSIYQLFWCSPGVQGFDPSPFENGRPEGPWIQRATRHLGGLSARESRRNDTGGVPLEARTKGGRVGDELKLGVKKMERQWRHHQNRSKYEWFIVIHLDSLDVLMIWWIYLDLLRRVPLLLPSIEYRWYPTWEDRHFAAQDFAKTGVGTAGEWVGTVATPLGSNGNFQVWTLQYILGRFPVDFHNLIWTFHLVKVKFRQSYGKFEWRLGTHRKQKKLMIFSQESQNEMNWYKMTHHDTWCA